MVRFYIVCYLDAFQSMVKGDVFGEGEFYFKCNGKRFPDRGVIKLSKGEIFNPQPPPVLYSAVVDNKEKTIEFDLEVREQDPLIDDKFLDQKFKIPIQAMAENKVLVDKKGRSQIKLVLKSVETKTF
jgi:hypothetical protein